MKFSLTVNSEQHDGFKLKVSTESDKELEIAKELTEALINKITKIEVSVVNYAD